MRTTLMECDYASAVLFDSALGPCSGPVEYAYDACGPDGEILKYVYLCEAHRKLRDEAGGAPARPIASGWT